MSLRTDYELTVTLGAMLIQAGRPRYSRVSRKLAQTFVDRTDYPLAVLAEGEQILPQHESHHLRLRPDGMGFFLYAADVHVTTFQAALRWLSERMPGRVLEVSEYCREHSDECEAGRDTYQLFNGRRVLNYPLDEFLFQELLNFLRRVGDLENLGFNAGRLDGRPRHAKDESGVTKATYLQRASVRQRQRCELLKRLDALRRQKET